MAFKTKKSRDRFDTTYVERFEEIMDEIEQLVEEAFDITKSILGEKSQATSAAKAYWRAQIPGIVSGGTSMETMADTFRKLKEELSTGL